jgi:hypothetical protein
MKRINRIIASLFLTAAIAAPLTILAATPQAVSVRVYDTDHKDYHNWDGNENKAWGVYQNDNHIKTHEFAKAPKTEQSKYWNWRHDHPDDKK